MAKGFNLHNIKDMNISTVLNSIKEHGSISRADLSRVTKLSPTTCTATTKFLITQNIIMEIGEGDSSGGRRPILLQLNPDYGCVFGVEVRLSTVRCSLYDMQLNLLYSTQASCSGLLQDYDNIIEGCANECIKHCCNRRVVGMMVGIPGIIDSDNNIVASQFLHTKTINIHSALEEKFDFPVYFKNIVKIIAFAEKKLHYKKAHSLVYILIENGIGSGIVIGDEIVHGKFGFTGELGHIIADRNGSVCFCGNKGCLEMVASQKAMLNRIKFAVESGVDTVLKEWSSNWEELDFELLLRAVQMGDRFSVDLMEDEVHYIYTAVINSINAYDPDVIIIETLNRQFTDYVIERLKKNISATIYKYKFKERILACNASHSNDVQLGAAMVALELFFENYSTGNL